MRNDYDLAVDFMDMTDDRHLWTRVEDLRPGLTPTPGMYLIVGNEDADPAVAQIVHIDSDGNIELDVLPGSADTHRDLLTPA